jgi:hypothetical protein
MHSWASWLEYHPRSYIVAIPVPISIVGANSVFRTVLQGFSFEMYDESASWADKVALSIVNTLKITACESFRICTKIVSVFKIYFTP